MPDMTNDPQRSITANVALSKLARTQAMIERALGPSFRDRMRNVSECYAATTRALEPSRRPGNALMEAMKAFDADSDAVKVYDRETITPLPPVRNFTEDLVRLQHEAAELRERERREEVDHRRQSPRGPDRNAGRPDRIRRGSSCGCRGVCEA